MILPMELMLHLYEFVEDIDARVALRLILKHQRYNPKCQHHLPPPPDFSQVRPVFQDDLGASVGFAKNIVMPDGSVRRMGYIHTRYMPGPDSEDEYDDYVAYYPGYRLREYIPIAFANVGPLLESRTESSTGCPTAS